MRRRGGASPSSSIDSSSYPSASSSQQHRDLSTDLRLGLSITTADVSQYESSFTSRDYSHPADWPPGRSLSQNQQEPTLFIKVYMEGIPIGRKLDLLAHDSYEGLLRTLRRMFRTTICCPDPAQVSSTKAYVLTYEDKDGDWMMVGDVPWEMFLTSVKKLKITKADNC